MAGLAEQIRDRATSWSEWRHNSEAREAYRIAALLNEEFFAGNLPVPVIGFDDSGRLQKEGAYHYEGDDIALSHHIDIRKDLVGPDLGIALLHNLVHMDTEVYGTKSSWYHPKSFRDRMAGFGVDVSKNGDAQSVAPNLIDKLAEWGLVKPEEIEPNYTETAVGAVVGTAPVPGETEAASSLSELLTTEEVLAILSAPVDAEIELPSHALAATPASTPVVAQPKAGSSGYFKWVCGCKDGMFGVTQGSTTVRAARITAYCTACGEAFKAV
jgi:hypothetical protein